MSERKYVVQVAANCLDVLLLLSHPVFQELTATEISIELNLDKTNVYRLLKTLESRDLVKFKREKWRVAPGIVKIADGFHRHVARRKAELAELEVEYLGESGS